MKARIKATGEIVSVKTCGSVFRDGALFYGFVDTEGNKYLPNELSFDVKDDSDYWDRLTHQAAISAMQGIMSNPVGFENVRCTAKHTDKKVAEIAICFAKELVEGLKLIRSN